MNIRNLFSKNKVVDLPITEDQFNNLITHLVKKYELPNWDHAAAVVANRIMHLPPDQATTTERYLSQCVLKNIAFQVAQARGQRISHMNQVEELVSVLKAEPNNQQARDTLQKAANEGSPHAKAALEKIEGPGLTLVPSKPAEEMTAPTGTVIEQTPAG